METKIWLDFGNDMVTVQAILKKDGNQWCVMIGENIQEGVAGFGNTISSAISEFKSNFRNS